VGAREERLAAQRQKERIARPGADEVDGARPRAARDSMFRHGTNHGLERVAEGQPMQGVKMVTDIIDLDRNVSDRWYVTNGATSVGPVSLDLITRGVEAGKVPLESFVRNETWKVWRPLVDLVEGGSLDDEESAELTLARRSVPPPAAS